MTLCIFAVKEGTFLLSRYLGWQGKGLIIRSYKIRSCYCKDRSRLTFSESKTAVFYDNRWRFSSNYYRLFLREFK